MDKKSLPKIYGVLGYPVKHSLSPVMHNAAFDALKINAEYRLFEIKPEDLEDFLNSLVKENIYGLNITIPYKEKILDFVKLNKESFYSRQIKAVNTIALETNIWKGFNTDIPGFSRALKENIEPINKKAAILGAGGAGKAVAYALADAKVKEISIYDIDKKKSQDVANMIKSLFLGFEIIPVDNIEQLEIRNKDLLINATPIGMKDTDPCLVREEMLHKNLFVCDLIYNPPETKLLLVAKKAGAGTSNGLKMLLYQGMLSFEIWTGQKAPKEVMQKALLKTL
jgi:shikimate dehydrogenase